MRITTKASICTSVMGESVGGMVAMLGGAICFGLVEVCDELATELDDLCVGVGVGG